MSTGRTEAPVLLLHSSCLGNYETIVSPNDTSIVNDGGGVDPQINDLSKQPISCDLLFLPEHHRSERKSSEDSPSLSSSRHKYLKFPGNHIHPCGISNVLTLENLPEWWKTGSVLLSLTSCNILYDTNAVMESTPPLLPIEPMPSTFVLDFHSIPFGGTVVENEGEIDEKVTRSITAGKQIAEIVVAFDVGKASRQASELLICHPRNGEAEKKAQIETKIYTESSQQRKDNPEHSRTSQNKAVNDEKAGEDSLYKVVNKTLEGDYCRRNPGRLLVNEIIAEEKLLLAHLESKIEHDTRTLHLVLQICLLVGLLLTITLVWAIYQYIRSIWKSDVLTQEARESMVETRCVLQEAVDTFHRFQYDEEQKQRELKCTPGRSETERTCTVKGSEVGESIGEGPVEKKKPVEFDPVALVLNGKNENYTYDQGTLCTNKECNIVDEEQIFAPIPSKVETSNSFQNASTIDCENDDRHGSKSENDGFTLGVDVNESTPICKDIDIVFRAKDYSVDDEHLHSKQLAVIENSTISRTKPLQTTRGVSKKERCTEDHRKKPLATDHDFSVEKAFSFCRVPVHSTSALQGKGKQEISFLGTFSKMSRTPFLTTPGDTATRRNSQFATKWDEGRTFHPKTENVPGDSHLSTGSQTSKRPSSPLPPQAISASPLSPCSQLAKEWNDRRATSRSNSKKRRPYLRPLVQIDPEDGEKVLFDSTSLSRVPPKSKLRTLHTQLQGNNFEGQSISGPSKLHSLARVDSLLVCDRNASAQSLSSENNELISSESEVEKETNGMKTPPPTSVVKRIPQLCYTPASNGDSFIDDYW